MIRANRFILFFCWCLLLAPLETSFSNSRRSQLLQVINEELREVVRLNKRTGNSRPKLLQRMAELLLEKAKLIREVENRNYLKLGPERRRQLKKVSFFIKSNKYLTRAKKVCDYLLRRHPNFQEKGKVYYILAFYAKEHNQMDRAREYYRKAIRYLSRNSKTRAKAMLALGELYYNNGQYSKAIPLYENALSRSKDKWWTKDLYNLAWCYFRVRRYRSAVNKLKQAYKLSKNAKFVDMSSEVETDIAYFCTEMGNIKEAVRFYKKHGMNVAANMIKVAKYVLKRGKYTNAVELLTIASKFDHSRKNDIEINMMLLSLYERFGKTAKHLFVSKKLMEYKENNHLTREQTETLGVQIQKMSALLQKQVVGGTYKYKKKIQRKKALYALEYFLLLARLFPNKNHKHYFFAAETLLASQLYNDAIKYYHLAYQGSLEKRNKKIASLSLNGLMACLGEKGVSKENREKFLVFSYKSFIKNNPRSKKTFKIYQRLFSHHFKKKQIEECEETLMAFRKAFPKGRAKQEVMLAKLIDYYKIKKNDQRIKYWIDKVNRREILVSNKYKKRLNILLLTLQFENVENANSIGDKKRALKGYIEIYKDKKSTKKAKKNACYNITVLFFELGDSRRMFDWASRSLKLMSPQDVAKFKSSFLAIVTELFNRREFDNAASLSEKVLKKICKLKKSGKTIFFKNAYVIYLAHNRIEEARKMIRESKMCNIGPSLVREARIDILKSLRSFHRWNSYLDQLKILERDRSTWQDLIGPLYYLYQKYKESNRTRLAENVRSKIFKFYNYSRKNRKTVSLNGLDVVAHFKLLELEKFLKKFYGVKLSYPERVYNQRLRRKFKLLDGITARATYILTIGSGKGIVKAYRYLVESYQSVIAEIERFVPQGKSKRYLLSFKKSMKELLLPIKRKVVEFRREARKHILNSGILSKDNYWFVTTSQSKFQLKYYYPSGGTIMDRGGRK